MKQFDESFHTDDFDQEMMDFIEQNYDVDKVEGWDFNNPFLIYHKGDKDYYVSESRPINVELLTKQEFKEKIGMIKNTGMTKGEFTLDDLEAGKHVVELKDGRKALVVENSKGTKSLFFYDNVTWTPLSNYTQNLKTDNKSISDIVTVFTFTFNPAHTYSVDTIWQREEKSAAELQYEECENKMKELQEQMDILSNKIKEGK